jgi:hypothetical protein
MRLRKPRRYSCGDVVVFGLELAAGEQLPDGGADVRHVLVSR